MHNICMHYCCSIYGNKATHHQTQLPNRRSITHGPAWDASRSPEQPGAPLLPRLGLQPHQGPHPAPWTVYLYFEQSCTLMPGSLTWIPRESQRRKEKKNTVLQKKRNPTTIIFLKRRLCLLQGLFVYKPAELMGGDCVAAFICSGWGSRRRPVSELL